MAYLDRLADDKLRQLLSVFPAVSIVGPRASGKTTSASRLAAEVVRLDEPRVANVFRADPDTALTGRAEPALLDEWQNVPEVLAAVKRAVDRRSQAGRFLLTGSVSAVLDAAAWPGTGRLVQVRMFGFSVRERLGLVADCPTLQEMLSGVSSLPSDRPDLGGYIDLALRSGFPEASRIADDSARRRWLDSYLYQLVARDVAAGRDPERLTRYLQAWALNSAGSPDDTTIHVAAGIDRRTHLAYQQLLANLYVIEQVPAWASNRLKRMVLAPKRYVCDPALMAAAARFGRSDVLNDADLLGRLIDTFATAEIRAHLETEPGSPRLAHLRTPGGRQEIDLIIEYDGGRLIAIEIKATATPTFEDARHLAWLRQLLGDKFVGGTVLHTGPAVIALGDRISAVPICALWSTRPRSVG